MSLAILTTACYLWSAVVPDRTKKIKLVHSPFWIKICRCLSDYDKNDLLREVNSTFGEVLGSEIVGTFFRLKVEFGRSNPLRTGIFISDNGGSKVWIPFKYENLPTFCFYCGKLGHEAKERKVNLNPNEEILTKKLPYSVALRVDSPLFRKESLKYGFSSKKSMKERFYVGEVEVLESERKGADEDVSFSSIAKEDACNLGRHNLRDKVPDLETNVISKDLKDFMEEDLTLCNDTNANFGMSNNFNKDKGFLIRTIWIVLKLTLCIRKFLIAFQKI